MSSNKNTRSKKTSAKPKAAPRKKPASQPQQRSGLSPRLKSILYLVLAILFIIMILFKGSNVWTMVRAAFIGVFGFGIILVPATFIYLLIMNEKEKAYVAHFKAKVALCILTALFAGALVYIICGAPHQDVNYFASLGNLYLDAYNAVNGAAYFVFSGGFMGGILGYPLVTLCGGVVGTILCILILLALIFILTNLSLNDVARAVRRARTAGEKCMKMHRVRKKARRMGYDPAEVNENNIDEYDAIDEPSPRSRIDIPFNEDKKRRIKQPAEIPVDSGIDIPLDAPKRKKRTGKAAPVQEGIDFDVVDQDEGNAKDVDLSEDLQNIIDRASRPMGTKDTTIEHIAEDISQEKRANRYTDGAKQADPQTVPVETKKKQKAKTEDVEDDEFANVGYHQYQDETEQKPEKVYYYPPVQLLRPSNNANDQSAMAELKNNSQKLIETLNSFGVNANIVNICRGPSVTRYELQPAPGVKISKITNLSDDIALNLAANGVRIEAPIPGKAAVGIEVPNKVVSMVSMRELIDSDEFRNAKSKLTAVLGRDISGDIVVTDIAKMPHLLIAGTTGSGKSVCVNSILISILYKATPDEVKLLLIDPKMVEFSKYKGIPHLLVPIVSDAKKAAAALGWAVNEMLNRYKIFSEYDCKDIDSYNQLIEKNLKYIKENPPVENEEGELVQPVMEINGLPVAKEKMSRVVIAIDELADLMMAAPSEVEDSICRLAQMARAAGMHLILATQRPTVNVITGLIKANVPSRISLKVSSNMDSRTILDVGGGEKLIGRGDMLFSPVGAPKPIRVQGCYASEEEIEGVTAYVKKSSKAEYNAEIEENIKRIEAEGIGNGKKGAAADEGGDGVEVDAKMEEAIQYVIEAGQASTSMLQRRLKVGYARAGRMIDDMEQLGIVGPHQGSKPRDVLMTYNEWLERRNVLQNNSD